MGLHRVGGCQQWGFTGSIVYRSPGPKNRMCIEFAGSTTVEKLWTPLRAEKPYRDLDRLRAGCQATHKLSV